MSNSVVGEGEKGTEGRETGGQGRKKKDCKATSRQLLKEGSSDATLVKPEHPVPLQNFKISTFLGWSIQPSEPAINSTWPG